MLVYLDNCCYNRPYDDSTQLKISLEAQAKMHIQNKIKSGDIILATSYVGYYENSRNRAEYKRVAIENFMRKNATEHIRADRSDEVEKKAQKIMATGVKDYDAYHIASAIIMGCDYFVSTDKRVLKYKTDEIRLINPIELVDIMEEEE